MLIRKADAQDLDAICRLAAQINRQHHQALPELFLAAADADATARSGAHGWKEKTACCWSPSAKARCWPS